jgi:ABC-type lipoprotein export system ATPase subunit
MLKLCGVSKTFAGPAGQVRTRVCAVKSVSLTVAAGEFVVICGPSGCGKSTLMLMAGGLLRPDNGAVILDDIDVYGQSPSARARLRAASVGFVFQQFHLIPYLSAQDNIRVPAMAPGIGAGRVVGERSEELLRRLGLEDRRNHVPAKLSVGEQQRVALGRALVNKPSLVLADEPTGNLDPASADAVLACLTEYVKEGGSVLLVTHDERASAKAMRVVRMNAGVLSA